MRILIVPFAAIVLAWAFHSCKSSSAPPSFCDTICLKDSLKFTKEDNVFKPHVYISAKNCIADTLIWNYDGMGVNRKLGLEDLLGTRVRLNPGAVSCFIKDTSYAWLLFNDCSNGRGYQLKIPFNKIEKIGRRGNAINSFDPKFFVAEGLISYTDKGNIFAEDMVTGKTATMTFGRPVEMEMGSIHDVLDSVNVTASRIWVKIKIDNEWQEIEKKIELK